MSNIETSRDTLRLHFMDLMCTQENVTSWKEDAKIMFLSLRSVYSAEGEVHLLSQREQSFYREYRHALKVLSCTQTGLTVI